MSRIEPPPLGTPTPGGGSPMPTMTQTPKLAATRVQRGPCSKPMNILFNTLLRLTNKRCKFKDRVMLYRIIDIIADRDFKTMGRLVVRAALLVGAAFFGWLVMAE